MHYLNCCLNSSLRVTLFKIYSGAQLVKQFEKPLSIGQYGLGSGLFCKALGEQLGDFLWGFERFPIHVCTPVLLLSVI